MQLESIELEVVFDCCCPSHAGDLDRFTAFVEVSDGDAGDDCESVIVQWFCSWDSLSDCATFFAVCVESWLFGTGVDVRDGGRNCVFSWTVESLIEFSHAVFADAFNWFCSSKEVDGTLLGLKDYK